MPLFTETLCSLKSKKRKVTKKKVCKSHDRDLSHLIPLAGSYDRGLYSSKREGYCPRNKLVSRHEV